MNDIARAAVQAIGVVVIGRNEGERLRRCVESLLGVFNNLVYVDSGSLYRGIAWQAIRSGVEPDNAEALFNLGFVQARLGQTEKALAAYRRALHLATANNRPDLAAKIQTQQNQLKLHQSANPIRQ